MASRRRATIIIDAETQQARKAVRNVGTELERLEGWSAEARSSVQRLAEASSGMNRIERHAQQSAGAVNRLAQQSNEASNAFSRAGRSGGNYNQVLFSLEDAAADARYGLNGAANNLSQLPELLSNASRGSKGFMSVLKGIGASLLGVGGIVFGIQILLNYGPQLVSFFTGSGEEAERFRKKMEEVAGELVDLQAEIDSLSFSVSGEDSIRAYADNLDEATQEQKALVQAMEQGAPQALSWSQQWGVVGDIATGNIPKLDKVNALVERLGVSADLARDALGGNMKAQAELAEVIQKSSLSLDEETRKLVGLQAESEAAQNKLAALKVTQEAAAAAMEAGARRAQDFVQAIGMTDEPLQTVEEGLQKLTSMQGERGFGRMEALAGEVQYLESALTALREETDVQMDGAAVEQLRQRLAASRKEMKALEKNTDDTTDALQSLSDTDQKLREARLRLAGATEQEITKNRLRHIGRRLAAMKEGTEAYKKELLRRLQTRLEYLDQVARARLEGAPGGRWAGRGRQRAEPPGAHPRPTFRR